MPTMSNACARYPYAGTEDPLLTLCAASKGASRFASRARQRELEPLVGHARASLLILSVRCRSVLDLATTGSPVG